MALSAVVSKKSVTGCQENINIITFTLVVNDGETEVINKDFAVEYRKGENIADKVVSVIAAMNSEIANYKACKQIFTSAVLDNVVNSIQGGIVL